VRQKKVSLGVCLISGKLHAFDGKHISIRFMKSFSLQREQVNNPANKEFIKQTFKKYFGRDVEITCFAEGEERSIALEEKARTQKAPEKRVRGVSDENKPVVKKLMEEFDGEVVRYDRS
jgi:hypothetical protein